MRTFVSIDTETGIIRRYSETFAMTHEAGLTNDPEDADATRHVIEGFRTHPHSDFRVVRPGARTFDDALAEQRERRAREAEKQSLLGHQDEA